MQMNCSGKTGTRWCNFNKPLCIHANKLVTRTLVNVKIFSCFITEFYTCKHAESCVNVQTTESTYDDDIINNSIVIAVVIIVTIN